MDKAVSYESEGDVLGCGVYLQNGCLRVRPNYDSFPTGNPAFGHKPKFRQIPTEKLTLAIY